jgi:hypothetical protein
MAYTIANLTTSATADVEINATLSRSIGEIGLLATGRTRQRADGVWPLWWHQYVANRRAEQAATKEKWLADNTVEADGYFDFALLMPTGQGRGFHDPDAADAEFIAALLPWLRRAA